MAYLGPKNGQKVEKGGYQKEDKCAEEGKKALTLLVIFISSTLEIVSGEKKTPA